MDVPWLATSRLELWRPSPDDADRIFEIHAHPATYVHAPHLRMREPAEAVRLLDVWGSHWEAHGFGYACVRRREDGATVGVAGIKHQVVTDVQVLNLYYRFDPRVWGGGYAAEAMRAAMTEVARITGGSLPFLARVARNNPASIRLAERLGLVRLDLVDPRDPIPHLLLASAPLG